MSKKGYYWYYINVYKAEDKMYQVFADRHFATKQEAAENAQFRLEGVSRHHADLHIMHYDKSDFNDFNENIIEI